VPGRAAARASKCLLTFGAHHRAMHWKNSTIPARAPRRPDKHVLFAIRYKDGSSAYIRIPPESAVYASRVSNIALEQQARGEIPLGEIAAVVRAR
jgi:hypothetical protein